MPDPPQVRVAEAPSAGRALSELFYRLGGRFTVGFVLSALLLLGLMGFAIYELERTALLQVRFARRGASLLDLGILEASFGKKSAAVRSYLLSGEEQFLRQGASARADFLARLKALKSAAGEPEERELLARISAAEAAHHEAAEAVKLAKQRGVTGEDSPGTLFGRLESRRQGVSDALAAFTNYERRQFERADLLEQRTYSRGAILLIVIGSGALFLALLMPLLLGRRLVQNYELERAERRRAEAAEARNVATLDTALDGIISIDHTGKVLEFNKAAEGIFGYRREEAIGKELAALIIPPSLRERHRQGLAEYLVSGVGPVLGNRIEVPGIRADGSEILVELSITRLPGEGLPVFTGFLRDVTERKLAESERTRLLGLEKEARNTAEASARRSAFLAEASALLASSLDYNETLRSVSRLSVASIADWCMIDMIEDGTLRRLAVAHTEPSRSDLAGEVERRHLLDPAARRGPAEVMRTGKSELIAELSDDLLRQIAKDSESFEMIRRLGLVSFIGVALRARGEVLGVVSFLSAESGRRYGPEDLALAEALAVRAAVAIDNARLYREAREAVQLREEFLSIASHELKTPVATLQLQLEGLVRKAAGPGSTPELAWVEKRLGAARRQVERLSKLIDGLLDVSTLTARRFELHLAEVDLLRIVSEVASRFEEDLSRAGCPLTLRAESPSLGEWDASRLDQVVTNLLANAVKYGAGRPITLILDGNAETARLTVQDEGIGILPENQNRIFERFERAVSERHYGGLGLGLFIVREIVEALGGSVRVASEPGKGAAFTVELPRRRPAAPGGS